MNPVQPVIPNAVVPALVEREGGGGTITATDIERAVLNSQEAEQGRADTSRSAEEAIARQQGSSELAAQARMQAAREGDTAPNAGPDPARMAVTAPAPQATQAPGPDPLGNTGNDPNPAALSQLQERLEARIARDMFPDPNRPADSSRFFDVT
ncbi:hypothetical protein [Ectothiorhodospira magna]|nr:hypothetical protein [Ectothiorhodospira magna]